MLWILLRLNVVYALTLDIHDAFGDSRRQQVIEMLIQNFDACCIARSH